MLALSPYVRPIVLLVGSNVFMTAAWYWHLRYKEVSFISLGFLSCDHSLPKSQNSSNIISFYIPFLFTIFLSYDSRVLTRVLT
jgi:Putative member of DMT superfamily (DUF486)